MLAFVHIPKTAGTTMKFILRNSLGLHHCDIKTKNQDGVLSDKDLAFAGKVFPWGVRSIAGHSLIASSLNLSRLIDYFTLVRDPLKRCASHYQHEKRGHRREGSDITFEEFVADEAMHNLQVKYIAGAVDVEKAKRELESKYLYVGITERFGQSMRVLQTLSPYPLDLRYERRHVAQDNSAKQEVLETPALRELLESCNQADMELYDFVCNTLYPRSLERSGLDPQCDAPAVSELDFYPYKNRITRGYNQAVYRTLMKIGGRFVQ